MSRAYRNSMAETRSSLLKHLSQSYAIHHKHPRFFHGRVFTEDLARPEVTWQSGERPRDDHSCPRWLTASEFKDCKSSLERKVERLEALLKLSERTVVYSGAGISVSAGLGQAAAGSKTIRENSKEAQPTETHMALAALRENGLIHAWVQQNHDGLPQKAGYPQESIVEIHGSWYDPSNPVVKYSGDLRHDLYRSMREEAKSADLVLVLGTSLSGLNADQVVTNAAERSLKGKSLGSVIINLQQTPQDGEATLRVFEETDHVLRLLLARLGIPRKPCVQSVPERHSAYVPYDQDGNRTKDGTLTRLDLSKGQKVRLNPDHNCQGSCQPCYGHIGADKPFKYRGALKKNGPGHGEVIRYSRAQGGWELRIEGTTMLLGGWWLEAAARGNLNSIPVINLNPQKRKSN